MITLKSSFASYNACLYSDSGNKGNSQYLINQLILVASSLNVLIVFNLISSGTSYNINAQREIKSKRSIFLKSFNVDFLIYFINSNT